MLLLTIARLVLLGVVAGSSILAAPAAAVTFTSDTTIAVGDLTYDGQDIVVDACRLTVNGPHAFNSLQVLNGAVVTHTENADSQIYIIDLTIAGDVVIAPTGRIDLVGRGFARNQGPGAGLYSSDSGYAGGGGYGGRGGDCNGPGDQAGAAYGSWAEPLGLGSGGSDAYGGAAGGPGGGAARLSVAGTLQVDGQLTADGANGTAPWHSSGGGSGGSLWLEVGALTGGGAISANGGNAGDGHSGGGSGGRIAIYYAANNFTGTLMAHGGTGYMAGGAGTIFTKAAGESRGTLVLDNDAVAGNGTPILEAALAANLLITDAAWAFAEQPFEIDGDLNIGSNGLLTHLPGGPGLNIGVAGDTVIDAGGSLCVSGKGHPNNQGPGAGLYSSDSGYGGGGGYGGRGGDCNGPGDQAGAAYGSWAEPLDLGSGGSDGYSTAAGGSGGGAARLSVAGALQVDGQLTANGVDGTQPWYSSGGGSGGSLWLTVGILSGSGSILANGGNAGETRSGGGAGGRIAIYYAANDFAGTIAAHGGTGSAGGAGTIFTKAQGETLGRVLVDNDGASGNGTPLLETTVAANLVIADAASAYAEHPVQIAGNLEIRPNAVLTQLPGSPGLDITVLGDALIDAAGRVTATGTGYPAGQGPGAGRYCDSGHGGGGGYGGRGGDCTGCANEGGAAYGSWVEPLDLGSGGSNGYGGVAGGPGGGAIRLNVSGMLRVDGSIAADGIDGTTPWYSSGGGSGGSLWLNAATVTGSGAISARGGNGGTRSGGGGGGRIAIYSCGVSLEPEQIAVSGGAGWAAGEAGTLLVASAYVEVVTQPVGGIFFADEPLSFIVDASTTEGLLTYHWRKDGEDLEDDARISGVHTAELTISKLTVGDTGYYDVRLHDDCGPYYSQTVHVVVPSPGDLNCDGSVNVFDIDPFVLALTNPIEYERRFADCRALLADCNFDGLVNVFDIDPFVLVLTGGR